MKKTILIFTIIAIALFFSGCLSVPPTDIAEEAKVKITGFEQEVYCGTKSFKMLNGESYKCCPDCDSCCPECETCPDCPTCETCPTCPEIPTCPDPIVCPEPTTCPDCPSCPCQGLKWGNLSVNFQILDVETTVEEICVTITFEDGTAIIRCVSVDTMPLVGKDEQIKIILPTPIERVIFVELNS